MTIKEFKYEAEKHGIKISRSAYYKLAEEKGLGTKIGTKYYFNRAKVMNWIEQQEQPPPENYITVNQMRLKFRVSAALAYKIMKDERMNDYRIEYNKAERGRPIYYGDEEKLRELTYEYKQDIYYKSKRGASVYDTDWL